MRSKLILIVGFIFSLSAQADVVVHPTSASGPADGLWISGQINAGDPAALQKHLPQFERVKIVLLDSPGGDVQAAMELGRILRRMNFNAWIFPDKLCASACVFVLAGAPYRTVGGKVGIHRPYQPNDKFSSPEQQKSSYLKIENDVKKYLMDMNVNPSLYDDMIRISPGKIKYLNEDELERYGLSETDPYVEEADMTESADSLRISKQEYLEREAKKEKECKYSNPEYGACATAIMYGITLKEYKRRAARAEHECGVRGTFQFARCFDNTTRGF